MFIPTFWLFILPIFTMHSIEADGNHSKFTFIRDYLIEANIKLCHIFSNWNRTEIGNFAKMLFDVNVRTIFIDSRKEVDHILENKALTQYGFILDESYQDFLGVLLNHTNTKHFRNTRPWLIFTNSTDFLIDFLDQIPLRMDTNMKIATAEHTTYYQLYDVYNPGFNLGGKVKVTPFGFWNGTTLHLNKSVSFYERRRNMGELTLRVGSVVLEANHSGTFEEYMLDSRYKHLDTMSKFHYPLFLYLQEIHLFNYTLRIEDAWFGNYQNGSDSALGRLLYREEIDVTCTGASQRPPRIDCYDYLMPSYHFRPSYIFRNPGSYDPLSNEFLKPFSTSVWFVTIAASALLCSALKLFHQWENKVKGRTIRCSWATSFLITLSPIVNQGSAIFPSGHSARAAFAVLLLMSILLYNYYTSSVISSLLSQSPRAFETLDELGHSGLGIGIENLPYTLTWYAIMNDSDVQYIYKNKVCLPNGKLNIMDAYQGIAKVKKGMFAYHTQLDTGYPLIARTFEQDEICDIVSIHMIPQVLAGMMATKHSQYYDLFQITLWKVRQAGFVQRISRIWESEKPECLGGARVIAVGIDQAFVAFLVLFVGMAAAVGVLVVERWWKMLELDQKFRKIKEACF